MIKKSYMKGLFIILTLISLKAIGQTEEARVKKTINDLFDGMRTGDTARMRSAFSAMPLLQTIVKNGSGETEVLTEPLDSFILMVARPHSEIYDERARFEAVKIDGDLAMVWAPYRFYLGPRFSHCGVDSFQLIRLPQGWKIQYLVDTRRRQECDDK